MKIDKGRPLIATSPDSDPFPITRGVLTTSTTVKHGDIKTVL